MSLFAEPRFIACFAIAARHAALPLPLDFIYFEILSFFRLTHCANWYRMSHRNRKQDTAP
jgi:hypothetical protein